MIKLIAHYKLAFLLLALAATVMTGSCGGESYWRDLEDGSSSSSLPPSFPVGMYVSTTGSDLTGDGSPGNPYQTIQYGITRADSVGLHAVFVEAGTYNISAEIVLLEGISLYGGFRPGDWNDRDAIARWSGSIYRTEIVSSAPRAVRGTGLITSATVIEGFVIYGPTAFYNENNSNPRISNNTIIGTGNVNSFGVYNLNSSPNIQFNLIVGTDTSASNAYGIYNIGGGSPSITINYIYGSYSVTASAVATGVYNDGGLTTPIIAGNFIYGGPSASISRGVHNRNGAGPGIGYNRIESGDALQSWAVYDEDCGYSLIGNDIRAGYGTAISTAIYGINSTTKIINNTIRGGGGATTDSSFGIDLAANADVTIYNNTIDGGMADTGSYGIRIFNAAPLIRNNIIFVSGSAPVRIGITEGVPAGSSPVELTNNNIYSCDYLYRNGTPAIDITDFNDLNISGNTVEVGDPAEYNISVILTLNADFRILTPPLSVREGGADLTGFLDDDKDENPRTLPWSIGAYEYD